jgi:hypothetical protein
MMSVRVFLFGLVGLLAVPASAQVSGFATLGAAWFSNPHADFAYNNHSTGPGNSRSVDLGLDSNLGLQWSSTFDQAVRLTAQTVVYRDASNHVRPDLTLLNAQFLMNDRLSLRVGRTQNPNFLFSDYRQVHYALPWIRPPREVYGVTSFFNYDGVQGRYQLPVMDDWSLVFLAGIAQSSMDYSLDGGRAVDSAQAEGVRYVSAALQHEDWTIKLSYETGALSTKNETVEQALQGVTQFDAVLAQNMSLWNKKYDFWALGAQYDSSDWLIVGELSWRGLEAYFGQRGGGYATLGRHYGQYMPYITLARTWTITDSSTNPIAQSLYDSVKYSASSLALGLSVALTPQMMLKTELQGIAPDPDSKWVYEQYDAQYNHHQPGQDVLLSVSLDMVF